MSTQLFIQKFSQGQPVTMPYDAVVDCVGQYGVLGRGPVGDAEITFEADAIAHYGLVVGDAAQGVQCVALVRPITDVAMRRLAFALMSRCGACLFDDALGCVFVVDHAATDLPAVFLTASTMGVQRIASPQQIWPDGLMLAPRAKDSPALLFDNPNPQGHKFVLFDGAEIEKKHLHMAFGVRPEACNTATLRALRNVLLKVDVALSSNPGFHVFYRFAHHEAQLQLLESPQIAETRNGATFVVSGEAMLLQEPEPTVAFRLEPELYFLNREKSSELRKRALADFGITVEPSVTGIAALEDMLERVHKRYRLECAGAPGGHAFNENALRWAVLAGAFLGERIRIGVGGQWGYLELVGHKIPVVQTHTERNCWPQQRVLNRIINGASDSVVAYFDELMVTAKSSTRPDIVADIPLLSHIMAGRGRFSGNGLPLQDKLPTSQLDFSVESLRALDVYLAGVHAQLGSFQTDDLNNLTLGAGAYIGEVLRRHLRKNWAWMNYADYFRTRPPNPELPKSINSHALLVGAGFVVLPMQAGNVRAWGPSPQSALEQVIAWLEHFEPVAQAVEADTAGPDALPTWDIQTDIRACVAALPPEEHGYLRILPPDWIKGDAMERWFLDYPSLLVHGRVVWAHLVQANHALFEPGTFDSGAELVYDPRGLLGPTELAPIAHQLFQLKNTRPADMESAHIAEYLTAETIRAFGLPVPHRVSDAGLWMSTVYVARAHLPNRRLSMSYFPILISDLCMGSTMILPSRWWPAGLVAQWGSDAGVDQEAQASVMDPPSVTAAKEQVLHVVESPVPVSDTKAWSYLDQILEREEARLQSLKPGLLGKLLGKRPVSASQLPKPVFVKYLGRMAKEYPGVYESGPDMNGDVLSLLVASESVSYVVETARREFGLTVFDSNRFNIVYRPSSQ